MAEADPLHRLPRAHALALRLKAVGADDGLIAECLGVEPEGVASLLEVAKAKLAHLNQAPRSLP